MVIFCEDQIFMDFIGFLYMKIYVVLYTQCLRCNIYNTWFLDIRISICFNKTFVSQEHFEVSAHHSFTTT